jgi:hypothetical protein
MSCESWIYLFRGVTGDLRLDLAIINPDGSLSCLILSDVLRLGTDSWIFAGNESIIRKWMIAGADYSRDRQLASLKSKQKHAIIHDNVANPTCGAEMGRAPGKQWRIDLYIVVDSSAWQKPAKNVRNIYRQGGRARSSSQPVQRCNTIQKTRRAPSFCYKGRCPVGGFKVLVRFKSLQMICLASKLLAHGTLL